MTRFEELGISEKVQLNCKFGKLVCWKSREDEDYREFSIDLIAEDGREYQVATIGTNEYSDDPHFNDDKVHIYLWDGQRSEDPSWQYMDPHGDGWYYNPNEEE